MSDPEKHGEFITDQSETEQIIVSSAELLGLISRAGPGANIKVRLIPKDPARADQTRVGWTRYTSDLVRTPGVHMFRDPRTRDWVEAVMPLGGHTIYMHPPNLSTSSADPRLPNLLLSQGHYQNPSVTAPLDAAGLQYDYELLPDGVLTPEELIRIEALDNPVE